MALRTTREPRWLRRYRMLPARGVTLSFLALAALVVAWQRGRDLQDLTWVPLYALLVPIVAMLIVAEIALPAGRLRTALAMPGLRWLGRIPYSLYRWQQLFFGPGDAHPNPFLVSRVPSNLFS